MRQTMRQSMYPLAAVVLTAAWFLPVPAANAQAQVLQAQVPPAQVPPLSPSEQTPNISDQKLDATAAALEQVASVREKYQQRIEAAAPADKPGVADEAKNALVKAITDQGLSVQEYTSILVLAQNDPVVREKILQRINPSLRQ